MDFKAPTRSDLPSAELVEAWSQEVAVFVRFILWAAFIGAMAKAWLSHGPWTQTLVLFVGHWIVGLLHFAARFAAALDD